MSGFLRTALLVSATAVLTFAFGLVAGMAAFKYKVFSTSELHRLSKDVSHFAHGDHFDPKEALKQYSRDPDKLALGRDIDSVLLPLKIKGVRLSETYSFPKVAGAITTIGNTVIILDRLGNIYSCLPDGTVSKLAVPALPNNVADYIRSGGKLDSKSLRAYSIQYLADPKLIVVSHELFDPHSDATRMAVSVIGFDAQSLKSSGAWKTIYTSDVEPTDSGDASGGRLAVAGHDKILLSVGVYKIDDYDAAQDPTSSFGKIVEISVPTGKTRIVSLGHRNPQGLVVTREAQILSTEHGPSGGDELNLITDGGNYGWPVVSLGADYGAYGWGDERPAGKHAGYRLPMFAWVPSTAVSSVIQVGGFNPRWDGDLLVGSLKAQSLFRLRLDGKRVVYSEPIWVGQRIRDIAQLSDGTIVLWTDDAELLFMSVDKDKLNGIQRYPASIGDTVASSCMFCHHFGPTSHADTAPSLSGVFDRRIASDNFRYSAALRRQEGVWNEKTLRAFLSDPGKFASGTSMPPPNLSSDGIDDVIRVLKQASVHSH